MFDESNLFYKMVDWDKRLNREKDFFKKHLEKISQKEGEILDLGCGIGHHLMMFAEWGFKGFGIDFSDVSIDMAIQKAKEAKFDHLLNYVSADMRDLTNTIEGRTFDLIICVGNSFALFPKNERENIINQAISALKPEGKLILQVVNYMKHNNETEWTINPNVFRNDEGKLSFFVRILEWESEKKEKVLMYVQRLHQDSDNPTEFVHSQKLAEFYVPKKDDFNYLKKNRKIATNFFGDFLGKEFEESASNDLIVIIERIKDHHKDL